MITFPIGSYFLTVNLLFGGKSIARDEAVRRAITDVTRQLYICWRLRGTDG